MSEPKNHLAIMSHEIYLMGRDGHLEDFEANVQVNAIETQIHEARKVFERLERKKENGK